MDGVLGLELRSSLGYLLAAWPWAGHLTQFASVPRQQKGTANHSSIFAKESPNGVTKSPTELNNNKF